MTATGLVGSSAVIDRLRRTGEHVLKTHTRKGVVWHYSGGGMSVIETPCAERLVTRGIIVAREASGQSFELAEEWK